MKDWRWTAVEIVVIIAAIVWAARNAYQDGLRDGAEAGVAWVFAEMADTITNDPNPERFMVCGEMFDDEWRQFDDQ